MTDKNKKKKNQGIVEVYGSTEKYTEYFSAPDKTYKKSLFLIKIIFWMIIVEEIFIK